MFLLSKKCSILLQIGIGLLLSVITPSGALKCYVCLGKADCGGSLMEKSECGDTSKFCEAVFDATSGDNEWRRCALTEDDAKVGCTINRNVETCFCDTDFCNTEATSDLNEGKNKGSKSGGEPSAGTLLIIILGSLITARVILPGGRNNTP